MRSHGVPVRLLACTIAVMAISLIAALATWGDSRPGGERQARLPMATVQNAGPRAIVVHASASGIEWRLGTVHSRSRRSFILPGKIGSIGTYRLIADLAGTHERIVTGPFTVTSRPVRSTYVTGPGQTVSSVRWRGDSGTGEGP